MNDLKIIAGNSNLPLAEAVAKDLGISLLKAKISHFSDGESCVEIEESVRGQDIFVIQSTCPPVNENLMELLVMIDALKRASAGRVTAVLPYYGYGRQDRKVALRSPITARLVADLISQAGTDRVLAMDLHAGHIQGFFRIPVDHIHASDAILEYLNGAYRQGTVVVSPDAGGIERARYYAGRMNADLAIIDKKRNVPNEVRAINVVGEVAGKTAIIVDDIIDTAGTMAAAAEVLMEKGAVKVAAAATHAVLSGAAIGRIIKSKIEEVVVTDTIPLPPVAANCSKLRVVSVHKILAEAIRRIHGESSIRSMLN